jgi:hypothetical protein
MARAETDRDGCEGSDAEDEEESEMKLLPQ